MKPSLPQPRGESSDAIDSRTEAFPGEAGAGRSASPAGVLALALLLALATAALFWRATACEFILYDDPVYVTENPLVLEGLTLEGIRVAFDPRTVVAGNWHPLSIISHMLDVALFGLDAAGHHAVNVAWHSASTALLFWLLVRMTGAVWPSLLVAALFGWHPLRVESVVWVSERKDVLSTFFWFATMAAYLGYVARPDWKRYALVATALVLGLLSKPMLVTVPLVLLLLDWWPLGRFENGPAAALPRERMVPQRRNGRALIIEKLPLLAIAFVAGLMTVAAQSSQHAVVALGRVSLAVRILNALEAYIAYVGKLVWPVDLAIYYPLHGRSYTLVGGLFSLAILAGITWLALRQARRRPYLAVGWLWYLITLLPVIGLVQVGSAMMADRYTYVPVVGLLIAAVWFLAQWAGADFSRRARVSIAVSIALIACAILTWQQIGVWRDTLTLFQHAAEVTENNYRAHDMLGVALVTRGDFEASLEHFDRAAEILPALSSALYNKGSALVELGRYDEAIASLERALELGHDPAAGKTAIEIARQKQREALEDTPGEAERNSN